MIKLKDLVQENCGCGSSCCSTKKESLNENVGDLKKIVKELEKASKLHAGQSKALAKASKMHAGQAKRLQGHIEEMNEESINEANPEAMVGKKLGAILKSLDKTVAQYKKKANVKSHMNFFEAGVKSVMRKHGIK